MEPTELNPLSKDARRELRQFAKRAARHGEDFNAAEPEAIREWLWSELTGEFDVDVVRAIYPLIISARRIALNERDLRVERGLAMQQQSAEAFRMYGAFPPVRELNAPTEPTAT